MTEINIDTDFIKLQQFLKLAKAVSQGSDAKFYIQNSEVKVNGEIETRRGRKIYPGDVVEIFGDIFKVIS